MSDGNDGGASLVRESGKLSLLTMVSRVLGLVREMTRAALMGTMGLADSFTIAFLIPNFMRRLFAEGSVAVAFIPTIKGYLKDGDRKKTEEFISATFTVLCLLVTAVTVAGMAAAPAIVSMFRSEPVETAVLTRLMFPFLALVSVAALLQGMLNAVGVFTPSGIAPILFNLCFIGVPWVIAPFAPNPARAMAVGVLAGGFAQAACQLPAVLKNGFRFGFIGIGRAFRNPGMRRVMALIAPTIVGMAAYQLNDIVCSVVASRTGEGVATSLTFSLRLQELILGVFAVSVSTVILPELAERAHNGEWAIFSERFKRGLEAIALITIPMSVFAMIEGRDIVALLFKTREFDERSVELTANAFFFHMLGLFFIAANRVIAPAFYAKGDVRNPTMAGVASFAINIPLAMILAAPMKGGGIALALSISSGLNAVILVGMLLRMRVAGMRAALVSVAGYSLRMLVFSAIAAAPVLFAAPCLRAALSGRGRFLSAGAPLLVSTLVFAGIGVGLLVAVRDSIASELLSNLFRKRARPPA
ncbi:MAG: murein biosynthesis integral membrane protein MurJ [Spirochaetes bacterium]|nr:murein biosynthesis integral membrane protein MurJ [Spirochaetota bacterium]